VVVHDHVNVFARSGVRDAGVSRYTIPVFTGLVEDLGTVLGVEEVPQGLRLSVATRFEDLQQGGSVAVDGVCLTAVDLQHVGPSARSSHARPSVSSRFTADVSAETLSKTTLGERAKGDLVNLERPLALGGRLGGHLVLGHIDGVGELLSREPVGEGFRFVLRLPRELAPLVVSKGSIALDGISLTVNELLDPDRIALFVIPETLRATTWGGKGPGARVNVEADILGKHVARLLQFR
jgi:riboflavin synthase